MFRHWDHSLLVCFVLTRHSARSDLLLTCLSLVTRLTRGRQLLFFPHQPKSPTTSSPSQLSLNQSVKTLPQITHPKTPPPSHQTNPAIQTSQNTMTNINTSQHAALQALTSLQQKSTNISSTFTDYAKNQTAGQVLTGLETSEQVDKLKRELVEDSFEIESLLHSCTDLGGEISIISQSFENSLVEIECLRQELARKNAVIEERDATITTLSQDIRVKNEKIRELEAQP
jgi:hypothetical protein